MSAAETMDAVVQCSADLTTSEHTQFLLELDAAGYRLTRKRAAKMARTYRSTITLTDGPRMYFVAYTGRSYPINSPKVT